MWSAQEQRRHFGAKRWAEPPLWNRTSRKTLTLARNASLLVVATAMAKYAPSASSSFKRVLSTSSLSLLISVTSDVESGSRAMKPFSA